MLQASRLQPHSTAGLGALKWLVVLDRNCLSHHPDLLWGFPLQHPHPQPPWLWRFWWTIRVVVVWICLCFFRGIALSCLSAATLWVSWKPNVQFFFFLLLSFSFGGRWEGGKRGGPLQPLTASAARFSSKVLYMSDLRNLG